MKHPTGQVIVEPITSRTNHEILRKQWKTGLILFIGIAAALCFTLIYSLPARALMLDLSLAELSAGADNIVVGTVGQITSRWNPEHTRISTAVVLNINESLKGSLTAGSQVTVTVPGGTVDGVTELVTDTPVFRTGETAVVFLKATAENRAEVYGQVRGKFDVVNNRVGTETLPEFKDRVNSSLRGPVYRQPEGSWTPVGPIILGDLEEIGGSQESRAMEPVIRDGWQTLISEGFEISIGSRWTRMYSTEGNPWTWESVAYNPKTGSGSAWCAGTSNQNPPASYGASMNAWMIWPAYLDLSDASAAELTFSRWIKTETDIDYLYVLFSKDDSSYYGYQYTGQGNIWGQDTFDLRNWPHFGDLTGSSKIKIAFAFVSDTVNNDTGVFLDDIQLRKYTGTAPQITGISPSSASAGTNSEVTITGTGFGSVPGSVKFFYRSGQNMMSAPIVSWSDTSIKAVVPVDNESYGGYPASAGSGPVVVYSAGGVYSNNYPFAVTFSYMGARWSGVSPVVQYKINPNSDDCTGEEVAVKNAADTWHSVPGKSLVLQYAGTTTKTSAAMDGENIVVWKDLGPTGTLAHAIIWFEDGLIYETDIEFNESYTWSTTSPASGQYDVQSLALHELGHCLSLRDLYGNAAGFPQDVDKVMFGFGPSGTTKRTLDAADMAGMQWIYPAVSPVDVDLSVTLQGDSRPESGWSVPLTVKFYQPGTTNELASCPLTTVRSGTSPDYNAAGRAPGITPGTYDISVVSDHCLPNLIRNVVISDSSGVIDLGVLQEGDVNMDGVIDILDFGSLAAAFGKGIGDTGYNAAADFDRNGRVDIADFGLLAINYAKMAQNPGP